MAIKFFDPIRSPGQVGAGPNQQQAWAGSPIVYFRPFVKFLVYIFSFLYTFPDIHPNCKYVYEYSFTFSQ